MKTSFLALSMLLAALPPALQAAPETAKNQPASLPTAEIIQVEVPREVWLDSTVEAIQQSTVSAQTGGQVEEIFYDVDDYVQQGSLLVRLRDSEQKSQLSKAEAGQAEAKAGLKRSQDNHQRISELHVKKQVSQAEMDEATANLESAKARVDAAEASLEQAREQLAYTQVKAPYSGILTQRHVELGEVAQPGKPLMTGVSLDRLRTLVDVPQSLIAQVRKEGQARVRLNDGSKVDATKLTVFPFADHGSNTFKVRVDLPQATPGLFPGMFVKTGFILGNHSYLVMPKEALVYRGEVSGTYVQDAQGKLWFRHLRPGPELEDGRVAILAGLEAGEKVVTDPIAAGVALKAQRQESHHGK